MAPDAADWESNGQIDGGAAAAVHRESGCLDMGFPVHRLETWTSLIILPAFFSILFYYTEYCLDKKLVPLSEYAGDMANPNSDEEVADTQAGAALARLIVVSDAEVRALLERHGPDFLGARLPPISAEESFVAIGNLLRQASALGVGKPEKLPWWIKYNWRNSALLKSCEVGRFVLAPNLTGESARGFRIFWTVILAICVFFLGCVEMFMCMRLHLHGSRILQHMGTFEVVPAILACWVTLVVVFIDFHILCTMAKASAGLLGLSPADTRSLP
jgi:hypothetical protein